MSNSPIIYGGNGKAKFLRRTLLASDGFPIMIDRRDGFLFRFDAMGPSFPLTTGVDWVSNGSGVTVGGNAAPGVGEDIAGVGFLAATTSGTHKSVFTTFNNWPVYNGVNYFEAYVRLLALDDDTDTYRAYVGFADNFASAAGLPVDSMCFVYDKSSNGNFWAVQSSKASTTTTYVSDGGGGRTTNAVTAGVDTYKRFTIIGDPANATVSFFIDGVLVTTVVTNLPDTISNFSCPGLLVQKIGGTTTNNAMFYDYIIAGHEYNNPRT